MSWYDNGCPTIDDPEVLATAELIRRLYAMPGAANGGPLHVILEDGNTGDEHVHDNDYFGHADGRTTETYLCKRDQGTWTGGAYHHAYIDELYCSEELADLSRLVLASFRRMPEPWRAAAIAWADGTAWEHLGQLAGETLTGGPPSVTDAQVEELIAELRRDIAGDRPESKACAPVPCPSFDEFDPAADMNAQGYAGSPIREELAQQLALYGSVNLVQEQCKPPTVVPPDGPPQPTLRWAELSMGYDYRRYGMFVDPPPQVDAARDASTPPRPTFSGFDSLHALEAAQRAWAADPNRGPWERFVAGRMSLMVPTPQDRIEQWLRDPERDTGYQPLFVGVPTGVDPEQLADAIRLCQQAGLLPDTPNGVVYLPEELETP